MTLKDNTIYQLQTLYEPEVVYTVWYISFKILTIHKYGKTDNTEKKITDKIPNDVFDRETRY